MAKTIVMVQHANGKQETICPKCGAIMQLHEGGSYQRMMAGEVYDMEFPDSRDCEKCGFHETTEDDRYFESLFGVA